MSTVLNECHESHKTTFSGVQQPCLQLFYFNHFFIDSNSNNKSSKSSTKDNNQNVMVKTGLENNCLYPRKSRCSISRKQRHKIQCVDRKIWKSRRAVRLLISHRCQNFIKLTWKLTKLFFFLQSKLNLYTLLRSVNKISTSVTIILAPFLTVWVQVVVNSKKIDVSAHSLNIEQRVNESYMSKGLDLGSVVKRHFSHQQMLMVFTRNGCRCHFHPLMAVGGIEV